VVDASALAVEGVLVTCSETDERATTAADGSYSLKVPADTTFTLRTYKPLFAGTTVTPIRVAANKTITHFDILTIPGPSIGAYNAQAGSDEARGVLAINVVSRSGRCDASSATVAALNPETLKPMPGALALYVPSGNSQPDRSLSFMQNGSKPNALLVGVPEGQDFPIRFEKAGCAALPFPVTQGDVQYQPGLRVALAGLTQVSLFVE
jgi:hypothetical protein